MWRLSQRAFFLRRARWAAAALGLSLAAGVQAGPRILLAEYVADPAPLWLQESPRPGEWFGARPGWRSSLEATRLPEVAGDSAPVWLEGRLERGLPWRGPGLAGSLDYRLQGMRDDEGFQVQRREFAVGPRLFLTPRSSTFFYYRYENNQIGDAISPLFDESGFEGEQYGTGLSQTWFFGESGGRLAVGVEFGGERRAADGSQADSQRLNLSGRIPLFWGLNADFEAGYSEHRYDGIGADVDRRELRASLSRALGERLEAAFQYHYADENAAREDRSFRREGWNLNLRYNY